MTRKYICGKNEPTIRRIDEHYRFALDFFWEYGTDFFDLINTNNNSEKNCKRFRVAFIGFGEYAYELLKVLCALGQLPRCRLTIYIFDYHCRELRNMLHKELLDHRANKETEVADSFAKASQFELNLTRLEQRTYHEIPFYEIHFVEMDVRANQFLEELPYEHEKIFTHMFFILGADRLNLDLSAKVSNFYSGKCKNTNRPKLYVMVESDSTSVSLKNDKIYKDNFPDIILMGANREKFAHDTIAETELDKLGQRTHQFYKLNQLFADSIDNLDVRIKRLQRNSNEHDNKTLLEGFQEIRDAIKNQWLHFSCKRIINDQSFKVFLTSWTEQTLLKPHIEFYRTNWLTKAIGSKSEDEYRILMERLLERPLGAWKDSIDMLYDNIGHLSNDYNRKEYYRRSSKVRVLFEKMLYELGYTQNIEYNKNGLIKKIPQNLVAEYAVDQKIWNAGTLEATIMKAFPYYEAILNAGQEIESEYKIAYETLCTLSQTKGSESMTGIMSGQVFELNNILHKRWMVFMWSEGYERSEIEENEVKNEKSKRHKYLRPYCLLCSPQNESFKDEITDACLLHTLDLVYDYAYVKSKYYNLDPYNEELLLYESIKKILKKLYPYETVAREIQIIIQRYNEGLLIDEVLAPKTKQGIIKSIKNHTYVYKNKRRILIELQKQSMSFSKNVTPSSPIFWEKIIEQACGLREITKELVKFMQKHVKQEKAIYGRVARLLRKYGCPHKDLKNIVDEVQGECKKWSVLTMGQDCMTASMTDQAE